MNAREAREVLLCYRPGTADDLDPQVHEALQIARKDPKLAAWLDNHSAFQKSMQEKLRSVPVPADLKQRLLARKNMAPLLKPMDLSDPSWRRSAARAAVAAAVILLLGIMVLNQKPAPADRFVNFQTRMVSTALRQYRMDVLTEDMDQLRRYLAKAGGPSDYKVPAGLQRLQLTGGGLLKWRSKPVSMVCFDRGDKQMLFLFVTDRSSMKDPPPETPRTEVVNELWTVSWREGDRIYLLAGPNDKEPAANLL